MAKLETLIVEEYGAYVGKHSERLRVTVKGEIRAEAPLIYLRQLIVKSRGVSLSSDAIIACAERGIAIHVVRSGSTTSGASLYTDGLTGTVATRRAQLLAYQDARAVHVAAAIAHAKIRNQAALLLYHARNRKSSEPRIAHALRVIAHEVLDHEAELEDLLRREASLASAHAHKPPIERLRNALLSLEGRAAQRYWEGVRLIVPEALGWPGRRHRNARDPFNCALNYAYAVLARVTEQALVLAGLDPFAGFLHADRPGKPSLTLDLIEEFRQPIVDRVLLGMVGKGVLLSCDAEGRLDDATRRAIAERVIARLEEGNERYEGNKRWALREIIQTQARHLATFLRGDRAEYSGFVFKP
ncbi:MAG: CRISPR-associated endonuclease Cas1 [Thermoflexales bacterium]|nr:CRISPR-associated endonuclease Cas1 [Thermoflexales bacterium]MDW8292833.1 CRISPR-associated endonuclease Cas1 [Anaerolineae bacterium]